MRLRLPSKENRPHPLSRLDTCLIGLFLLVYLLYLSGNYFLPFQSLLTAGLLVILLVGIAARLYLTYRPGRTAVRSWLATNWPLLALAGAVGVAGLLRWQALNSFKNIASDPAAQAFANDALGIIRQSNWQARSFQQPPLYLYLAALVAELNFVRETSAGKLASPDGLSPTGLIESLGFVNLLLGLLSLIPTWAAASRLWHSQRAGAVAALLLATSWLAYQATPALVPQTLAALLTAGSFYYLVLAWQNGGRWSAWWAGGLAGLATAAAYGAFWLMVPVSLGLFFSGGKDRPGWRLLTGWAGWLAGWTLGAPGWILSLNTFVEGLASVEKAPAGAAGWWAQQALANDVGLVVAFGLALVMAFGTSRERVATVLALGFPLLYAITLNLAGPLQISRLALVVPVAAIAASRAVEVVARRVQQALDAHDDRHKWGGTALTTGLVLLIIMASVLARRVF